MELDLYMLGSKQVGSGELSLSEFYSMEAFGRIWPSLKSKGRFEELTIISKPVKQQRQCHPTIYIAGLRSSEQSSVFIGTVD
jgi:hypothetical protein